ncbi:MAG: DegV family protein [Lachnoclostridium sp.]
MERIAIVTDSNSGLSVEEAKQWNIKLLPMTFFVDGNEHKEGITLKEEGFR